MTENKAKEALKHINLSRVHPFYSWEEMAEVRDIAIKALEEIQQYQALGTVEEIKKKLKTELPYMSITQAKFKSELDAYRAIGTVEELREAAEKQRAKKPIRQKEEPTDEQAEELVELGFCSGDILRCPCCGEYIVIKDLKHCMNCGQALDRSEQE